MIKIGVTGGIGSGKTIVCEIFKSLGVPVFNADEEAKKLLPTSTVKDFYFTEFGESVFTSGEPDKQKIAKLIFNDRSALEKVDRFIHPLVFSEFKKWCLQYENKPYIIHEAALIFESNSQQYFDAVILVYSPVEDRIKRVIERDNVSKEQVIQRIKNQMDDEEKRNLADYILENDGSTLLVPQVLNIHEKILKEEFKK